MNDYSGLFFKAGRAMAYRKLQREHKLPGSTLQSKIHFKMAWDRNPLLGVLSDKLLVRSYISEKVGDDFLVPLIGIWDSPVAIPWQNLPGEYVVKVTHGSGGVIVVTESAPDTAFLPMRPQPWSRFEVHPKNFDTRIAEVLLSHWQTLRYEWWPGRKPEFGYRNLLPKIIVEELIKPPTTLGLIEVKAYTFNGLVQYFELFVGGVTQRKQLLYLDRHGDRIPVRSEDGGGIWPELEVTPALPWLERIIELSEKLGAGLDFIRVDFLTSDDTIYIGELTSYVSCGDFSFEPEHYDKDFGADWHPRY